MKIDFQDGIDDYLLDRMSDEERKRFESDVTEYSDLKEQLSFTEIVQKATKSRNEKLAAMEEWKNDYEWEDDRVTTVSVAEYRATGSGYDYFPASSMEERRVAKPSSFKKVLYWGAGIAVVFIVGVFIFNFYSPLSSEKAMEAASRPNKSLSRNGDVSFRGRNHDVDIETQLAMGDYNKALVCIEKKEADVRMNLMLLERDLYSRGESHEDVMTEKNALEMKLDRLLFLKAQALVGLGRIDEACVLLDKIRHSKSDYGIKADSLYHLLQ